MAQIHDIYDVAQNKKGLAISIMSLSIVLMSDDKHETANETGYAHSCMYMCRLYSHF